MSLAASKRANELEQALNAWEDNRLLTSGVVKLKQVCFNSELLRLQEVCHSTVHM
jgi:pre-mRNA-splicing factor ATP-dependent RNA helicase DHX38/PRP16